MKNARNILPLLLLLLFLTGCEHKAIPTVPTATPTTSSTPTTQTTTSTAPLHSPLYLENTDTEDVITYFNEVCLDAEFVNGGDASLLQKWDSPIRYRILGDPTEQDLDVLYGFTDTLNAVNGFPGIREITDDNGYCNMQIHFCSHDEMIDIMGDRFQDMDGAVTFWYEENRIYNATICIRTDLDRHLRNSVILEELYNSLGPIQDTALRQDSIIYADYAEPQALTPVDELLLKLLYHPQMLCGMNAAECETVIRQLYY